MIVSKSTIRKLVDEIGLIASTNPAHRLDLEGRRHLGPLVQAINDLADRCGKPVCEDQPNARLEYSETEVEQNILAAFISELPEGVLICNAEGQILLLNRRALDLTATGSRGCEAGVASGKSPFLGDSITRVIDKHSIEHALEEINARLKRNVANAESCFVITGPPDHILRVKVSPILNRLGQFAGFILMLRDITAQRAADERVDQLLQSLTKNARSPLASIRAAIETLVTYEDLDDDRSRQFRDIIFKESLVLSDILNQVASDYASLVEIQRALTPLQATDLLESVKRRAIESLGIVVTEEKPAARIWVKADAYSITAAILFTLSQVKRETGAREFEARIEKDAKFANLDLIWEGDPIKAETLHHWETQLLVVADQKSPLTLKEVLRHHQGAIWSYARADQENLAYIRFLLPAQEKPASESLRPMAILPESPAPHYDIDLLRQPGQNPELDDRLLTELTYTVLLRELQQAGDIDAIVRKHDQLPRLIYRMITSGAKIRNVTWLITAVSDTILIRLIEFAIEELGQPPVPFAFITMGSEGRKEQTLKTDQDNAIVFGEGAQDEGSISAAVQDYFVGIARKVCGWLDRIGYHFCTGEIMARNPNWCQPLSTWKRYFSAWIHAAEPEDLLHTSIFFDFRFVHGDPAIVEELRKHLFDSLQGWPGFFRHMTENAVHFKPPIGFFGNFSLVTKGRHRKCLDLKNAMLPIVDFARILALNNGIRETNTQERLYLLSMKKVLPVEEYNEIEQAYGFLMQLRIVQQIKAIIEAGTTPDNCVNPKKLSGIERKMLKEIFRKIGSIQTKLSFQFVGTSD